MRKRHINPSEHTVYNSLREFMDVGEYPPGVLTVMQGGLPIDVRHDPRGYDTTIVIFHAALSSKPTRFPVFMGAAITESLPANRVFISDPSLYMDDTLRLAWYAGNSKQPRLQWTLRSILKSLIPSHHHVVTFGPSGGGFAALYYASKFNGAIAVPVNPQTNIAMYPPAEVERYMKKAWGLSGPDALGKVTAVTDLARVYQKSAPCRVFYVQNRNDSSHMRRQLAPFMASLPVGHDAHPVLVDGPVGHQAPNKAVIRAVLAAAVEGAETPPLATILESLPD